MLPLIIHVLLLIQFPISSSLVSFDFTGSFGRHQVATLDAQQRRVAFNTPAAVTVAGIEEDTEWQPIQLQTTGPNPSAMAAGLVWSAPSLVRASGSSIAVSDPATSLPLPFLAVAAGRTLRIYAPNDTKREFETQTLLFSSYLTGTLILSELQLSRCMCGLVALAPNKPTLTNSTLETTLFLTDSEGGLSSVKLAQGRISSGSSRLGWAISEEKIEVAGDSTATQSSTCAPCNGEAILLNSTSAMRGGIYHIPRSYATRSMLVDANEDGLLDFVVVRSSVDSTLLTSTSSSTTVDPVSNLFGMELRTYLNRNGTFELVTNPLTTSSSRSSGASPQGRELHTQQQTELTTTYQPQTQVHQHRDGLRGMSNKLSPFVSSAVRSRLHPLSSAASIERDWSQPRANYFETQAVQTVSTPIQVLRIPDTIAFGYFDNDGRIDMVIGVTEYVNGTSLSLTRSLGGFTMSSLLSGLLVRRRLVTLFGTSSSSLIFRFDSSVSVSDVIESSKRFLIGTQIPTKRQTYFNNALQPLLTTLIPMEKRGDGNRYTSTNVSIVLSDGSDGLRTLSSAIPILMTYSILDIGFKPFSFELRPTASPFFDPASKDAMQSYQLTSLTLLDFGFGSTDSHLRIIRPTQTGRWDLSEPTEQSQTVYEVDENQEAPLAAPTWNTSVAGVGELAITTMPTIQNGPHASMTLVPITQNASVAGEYNLALTSTYIDTTIVGFTAQLSLDYASNMLYPVVSPPVIPILDPNSSDLVSESASQSSRLFEHTMSVLESYRIGWADGVRTEILALALKETAGTDSPVTWTFLSLLVLIVAFAGCILFRRRSRLFAARQLHAADEVRAVLAMSVPPQTMAIRDTDQSNQIETDTHIESRANYNSCDTDNQSTRDEPNRRANPRNGAMCDSHPVAPPNTGCLDSSAVDALDPPPPLSSTGILIFEPRIEAPTAGIATTPEQDEETRSDSRSIASPPSQLNTDSPAPALSLSPPSSIRSSPSTGFELIESSNEHGSGNDTDAAAPSPSASPSMTSTMRQSPHSHNNQTSTRKSEEKKD